MTYHQTTQFIHQAAHIIHNSSQIIHTKLQFINYKLKILHTVLQNKTKFKMNGNYGEEDNNRKHSKEDATSDDNEL